MAREYVVVDLETTGLDLISEEIIEIAAVKIRRGLIVDEFSTLVSCKRPIRPEIQALVGISEEMLVGQPDIYQVLPQLEEFIGDAALVAHNAPFDAGFLHKYWPDERLWLDTLVLAQIAFPCANSYALGNLSAMLDLEHDQAHRALSDAKATAALFIVIEKELERLPFAAKEDILILAAEDDTPTGALLRRKCKQQGTAAPAEPVEKEKRTRGKRVVDEEYQLDLSQVTRYLGPDSAFRERLDGFEERPQQLKMSLAVAKTLNANACLLAEAGTGTGKSLAYLLPAALFALGSGNQVAISTHTRNLQEQLLHKDIPMLCGLLEQDIKAVVVKGRSNYLCRRLYRYMLSNTPENMRYFMMRVAVWRALSQNGDGGELSLTSFDRWKWQRISASRENCAPFCPYRRKNACIVQRVRSAAAQADVLILNHSLLIADAAIEKGFLPELPYLIVDEAQHLERAAEDQLTTGVDIFEILHLLGRLSRKEKGKTLGALSALRKNAPDYLTSTSQELSARLLDTLANVIEQITFEMQQFFDLLDGAFRPEVGKTAFFPARVRILPSHRERGEWLLICQQGEALAGTLGVLSEQCFRLLELFTVSVEVEEKGKPGGYEELFSAAAMARELSATLRAILDGEDENYVPWLEFSDATKKPSLHMAPIEINEILQTTLYERSKAMVLTSATLAAGSDFTYFKRRLGLDLLPEAPQEMVLPAPFFYRDQALFTVVNDLPDWSKCSEILAADAIGKALIPLLSASHGRAIVLFTSHHQLKSVFDQIRDPLKAQGITVLAHGVSGSPSALLERLKKEENCCILGANSFWEGIDVIGSALSMIVVVRLPFWPPNSPLTASRMERIEAEGRSSFSEYSLPQALIRFKQGFGRLIRSEQDSGVFCVLDRRIVEKNYGSRFIRSLPEMERVIGSSEEIAERIRCFLG